MPHSHYTRREFAKIALGAVPVAGLLSGFNPLQAAEAAPAPTAKPNSKVNGVQIGLNVPYSFGNPAMSADDVLANCLTLGVGALELRTQPVEAFLGAPVVLVRPRGAVVIPADAAAEAETLQKWRLSLSMDRVREFRKKYESAGVLIEIVKVDGLLTMKGETLDYVFTLAKALGATALSTEIAANEDNLKRVGQFADKHAMMVGYHGHASTTPAIWERAFSFAKYNGANLDLGHFVAGNNLSPVEFMKKQHARITHVHVKDRKMHEGPNTPFGEGDTPIVEVLRLIRDNRWPIQATIEFEYPVPAGSNRMAELARAIKYCRDALA
ncbi:MAG: TIM barrel protein [Opitutaceae bacterium]